MLSKIKRCIILYGFFRTVHFLITGSRHRFRIHLLLRPDPSKWCLPVAHADRLQTSLQSISQYGHSHFQFSSFNHMDQGGRKEGAIRGTPPPPNIWNFENNCVSTNAQSRFASSVPDSVLGPLRLVRHTCSVLVSL